MIGRRRAARLPGQPDQADQADQADLAEPNPVLGVDRVSVRRGQSLLLDQVSLAVRPGELLALVGPNGAGKSTLLSVLSGDIAPNEGTVQLHGRALADWTVTEVAMRRAVLLQQVSLSFPFTVAEVIEMGRSVWAGTERDAQDEAAIATAMAATGVTHLAGRRFPSLSGGERARVALARVLAQQTGTLLLDEPTAALDLHHQELVLEVAKERTRAGTAVVVVVHDLGLAAAHADRIVLLSNGRLVADSNPQEVLDPVLLSAVYGHDIEVIEHPRTGYLLVLPRR
jgi:iron complex transport system ATP-binding protein